MKFDMIFS